MRVLAACSLGGAGHLQPLLPLLDAARERGHETLVVATPGLAGLVARSGHPFAEGGEPPESEIAPIREALPVVPTAEASVLGNRELFGRLATDAMLPSMTRVLDEWRPDLVLRDPCEYASSVVAPHLGILTVQVAISLAGVEWGSVEVAADALESHRRGLVAELLASPYVTRFPASCDPSPFLETRRYRTRPMRPAAPLPDWWDGSRAPLVYVSLGSVLGHMSVAETAYRTVLHAVTQLDARVLLTVGRFDASLLEPVPSHVHVEPWVDQMGALGEAELVVCHGGSGTTLGALGAGVPVVIVPQFGDQFANGRWVVASDAGIVLDLDREDDGCRRPIRPDDAPRIAAAIDRVRAESSYRIAAQRIAAEMSAEPAADTLVDDLVSR